MTADEHDLRWRWCLGSVAERVVRASVVPLLDTRAARPAARQTFERLVLAQGGTDDAAPLIPTVRVREQS